MNWIGMVLVLVGIIYLIYSILARGKVTYYNRKFGKRCKIKIIKLNGFLKLQLIFSILISMFNIILGISIILLNLNSIFIFIGLLILHIINFLLVVEGKKKGYVYYE